MPFTLVSIVGLVAGLHAASYGAYKDSPHESFLPRRFVRELVLATGLSAGMVSLGLANGQSLFVLYLAAFALSRIATEFWKLFLRVEPQSDYRIPTQIHWCRSVIHNPAIRVALGVGFVASIYGIYRLSKILPPDWPVWARGLFTGLSIGISEAIAGGYKDGAVEGFSWRKFFKSPVFGSIGGLVAAGHTVDPAFLLLGAIGTMRMLLELLFKMVVPNYAPGKFRSIIGPYAEWQSRRNIFLRPYALTWMLYLVLCSRPSW